MFKVTKGGFLDIDIQIKGPDGRIIYNAERQTEGKYSFVAHEHGLYTFCFSNRMSTLTPKVVSFVANIGEAPPPTPIDGAKPEHLTTLEASVAQLAASVQSAVNEQSYLKMREAVHRNTNESTNGRVIWWSLFEVLVLLAMSLWQIYYLRRFFEVKRPV